MDGGQTLQLNAVGATNPNGNVSVSGAVGGTTGLTSFTVSAGNVVSLASVKTVGVQSVTGNAAPGGITLTGTYQSTGAGGNAGNISFSGPVSLAGRWW